MSVNISLLHFRGMPRCLPESGEWLAVRPGAPEKRETFRYERGEAAASFATAVRERLPGADVFPEVKNSFYAHEKSSP